MTRVALDTNVLVYAELEPASRKGQRAQQIAVAAASDGVVSGQVFAEFLRVVQRQSPARLGRALTIMDDYLKFYASPATTPDVLKAAVQIVDRHRFQMFDAIIVGASASAGASVLLSEDMQDGQTVGSLQILNPFNPANDWAIDALFQS